MHDVHALHNMSHTCLHAWGLLAFEEPRQLRTQLPEVYIGAYIREPMASALIEQINTVSKLTRTIKDEKSRADLLSAQAVSIREQIMNVTLTSSDCDQLVEAIDQSDFSDESKTELGKAVLQQLGKAAKKVPKRSNQTVEDLGPFLTTTDVEMLTNVDMTLLSKVQRLATVLARIGCMNPTEPTYGKALTLLKKHFHMSSLQDPKTFYDSVQDLKASLKSQKTWGLPTVHITTYSTPDALPQELFDRAFSEEKPAGFQATVMGRLGPLRKSSLAIREESSGSAGPGPFMLNLAGTRPNPQFTNTPMMNPMMHTMMNSFMGGFAPNLQSIWPYKEIVVFSFRSLNAVYI